MVYCQTILVVKCFIKFFFFHLVSMDSMLKSLSFVSIFSPNICWYLKFTIFMSWHWISLFNTLHLLRYEINIPKNPLKRYVLIFYYSQFVMASQSLSLTFTAKMGQHHIEHSVVFWLEGKNLLHIKQER